MARDRWATFDCYGTLIDWNGGIRAELARVFGDDESDELLRRYHELEPQLEADGKLSYREVLTEAMRRLGAPPAEEDALAQSLPAWLPFPEVPVALKGARGPRPASCGSSGRCASTASGRALGHWRAFEEQVGRPPDVHVAASLLHDVGPANELGLPSIWINRLGETPGPQPTRELPDLTRLADTLDELA